MCRIKLKKGGRCRKMTEGVDKKNAMCYNDLVRNTTPSFLIGIFEASFGLHSVLLPKNIALKETEL